MSPPSVGPAYEHVLIPGFHSVEADDPVLDVVFWPLRHVERLFHCGR